MSAELINTARNDLDLLSEEIKIASCYAEDRDKRLHELTFRTVSNLRDSLNISNETFPLTRDIVLFPQAITGKKALVRHINVGELAFSSEFDECQCLIAINNNGSVYPFHFSPTYIRESVSKNKRVIKILESANIIYMLGVGVEENVHGIKTFLSRDANKLRPINIDYERQRRFHDVYLLNSIDKIDIGLVFYPTLFGDKTSDTELLELQKI